MDAQRHIDLEFEGQKAVVDKKLETFDQLKSFIIAKFTGLPERIKIFYLDSDNDEITVSCNEDLEYFLLEEKQIALLQVKIYSDSDATEEEEGGDDEDFSSSSCCDSESGEERQKELKKEEELKKKEDACEVQVNKPVSDEQVGSSEIVGEELEEPSKKEENKGVQCGVSTCDQSEQIGNSHQPGELHDASGQTVSVQCQDDGTQAIAELKDDSTQAKAEQKDNEIQAQADSQDSQTQAQVQSSDFQTQARVDQSDLCTQVQVDHVENGMQTNLKEMKENGQQAREEEALGQDQLQNSQSNSLERKLLEFEVRLKEELSKRDTLIEQMRQDIETLQENEKQTEKKIVKNDNYFDLSSWKASNQQNSIQDATGQGRITQLKVALSQAAAQFNALPSSTSKEEAEKQFANVISTLQLALTLSDVSSKVIFHSERKADMIPSKENKLNQNSEIEESKDDAMEQLNSDLRIVINQKNTLSEDQEEERLRAYQQKLQNQHASSEIDRILKEKEHLAKVFNQEVADNLHKDYPPEVVKKATEIATLTGEQPSLYFKYVSDYSSNSVNDLIDMLFNHNIAFRYFPK